MGFGRGRAPVVARSLLGRCEPPKPLKLALYDYAEGKEDANCPHILLEAILCEAYHCLPSQLDGEDASRLLRSREALALYRVVTRTANKPKNKWTLDERRAMGELLNLDWERDGETQD